MEDQYLQCTNDKDDDGNPAGGGVDGKGILIRWQRGPIPVGEQPSGALLGGVLKAVIQRLEFYQASKFACDENQEALEATQMAYDAMKRREADRKERGVEGKHEV